MDTFLQKNRYYELRIIRAEDDENEGVEIRARAKLIWYLRSSYTNIDSMYYGMEFEEFIQLPDEITKLP
ncbi:MAG: hypothetical protein H7A25_13460 [Leptospiraceae bacterium]|nr:hypothetical protein [Leptospiraceae bacterium]